MIAHRTGLIAKAFLLLLVFAPLSVVTSPVMASEIKIVVNGLPITTYDIQRRTAFLKLQGKKGGAKVATDELIEQALKVKEMQRLNIKISDGTVDDAFARFAGSNKLSTKQMAGILGQAGVTADHFKEFIRVQMGWNQALSSRFRTTGQVTEQDAARRMLQQGGSKPSATEYLLQQVIFVVPAAERGSMLGRRKKEAEAMRLRFTGCDSTREFAKGLVDVTVRDLGKVLAPQLPPEWAESIKATKVGAATKPRETDRGVEFIGICSSREVSDDRVAQLIFSNEGDGDKKGEELSNKYLGELRTKATIVQR